MIPEILHAIGLTILIIGVVPYIDATMSVAMFSLVGFIPALLHVYSKHRSIQTSRINRSRTPTSSQRARRRRDFLFGILAMVRNRSESRRRLIQVV